MKFIGKILTLIAKTLLCAVAGVVGTMLSGVVTGALHLPAPALPPGTTVEALGRALIYFSPMLAAGLVPMAIGLGGGFWKRWAAISTWLYVAIGINTVIEAKVFSSMVDNSVTTLLVSYVFSCALLGAALAWAFGKSEKANGFGRFTPAQWAWRIAVAWLAFPVIYLAFGMCVAPFVTSYYFAGVAGLKLPSLPFLIMIQLLRSPLFLVSTIPVIALWRGSRRNLMISLGLAEAMIVGIYGLSQATWFPTVLRVAHSIEITCDSFAYIAVLALLFAPECKQSTEIEEPTEKAMPMAAR